MSLKFNLEEFYYRLVKLISSSNSKINISPSKFEPGVSRLWRGVSLSLLNKITLNTLKNKIPEKSQNIFFFSSARTSISAILKSHGIREKDEVVFSTFTCPAVIFSVISTGAKAVQVDINEDLTMNYSSITKAINNNTAALIIQNTEGREGLTESQINKIKKNKKIIIIEDNCLSIGSKKNNKSIGNYGDYLVESFEVSKSFTIGWGGKVTINNKNLLTNFRKYYHTLNRVNIFSDLRNFIQLYLSVILVKNKLFGGFLIWYFLYGLKIFQSSTKEDVKLYSKNIVMGRFSEALCLNLLSYIPFLSEKANSNYSKIRKFLSQLNIKILVDQKEDEFIVSPRISIRVDPTKMCHVHNEALRSRVAISNEFPDVPHRTTQSQCKILNVDNAKNLSNEIVNIPIYWSFNENEINRIKIFIEIIAPYCKKNLKN